MVVEDSQGRLPERGDTLVEKLSRSWLGQGREKSISCKRNSIGKGQEVRCNVVGMCMVLGFVEETIFHKRGGYHPLASLSTSDQKRTEGCELIMKAKENQGI